MKFFLLTDLEGPAGVEKFTETRTNDVKAKSKSMKQLALEVNACMEGIREMDPAAEIIVWDGHGPGGLIGQTITGGQLIPNTVKDKPYWNLRDFDAVLFVGQHAMAGAFHAPLCHTYSSTGIAYYKLNGIFVGEFGCRALAAGLQGVPVIFLSGDDKAVLEAKALIPNMETVAVKQGTGLESAIHLDSEEACRLIREGAYRSVARMKEIEPFTAFAPPYSLEIRFFEPFHHDTFGFDSGAQVVDSRTILYRSDDLSSFPI
ncbi:M55 family metallopeptidase [Paenibacillus sp. HB172176]|uniref:M55 family metallopeptidase n=1 Tax=Paenibacillus sp. HB172176 TaxID=2493690 RepID=UPI00143B5437|nr:M55 family metallopeptidase [Paenibacillus sp. HB172176]